MREGQIAPDAGFQVRDVVNGQVRFEGVDRAAGWHGAQRVFAVRHVTLVAGDDALDARRTPQQERQVAQRKRLAGIGATAAAPRDTLEKVRPGRGVENHGQQFDLVGIGRIRLFQWGLRHTLGNVRAGDVVRAVKGRFHERTLIGVGGHSVSSWLRKYAIIAYDGNAACGNSDIRGLNLRGI